MAASSPKDENGEFDGDIICTQFQSHQVFRLSIWKHPWLIELSSMIRQAEQQEHIAGAAGSTYSNLVAVVLRQFHEIKEKLDLIIQRPRQGQRIQQMKLPEY